MRYYFALQYRMLNRHITDFGLLPVVGYLLTLVAFTGLSVVLFRKTEYAVYIYFLIAFNFVLSLSSSVRNGFLKTCFSKNDYYVIRILENIAITLPFVIFLLFQKLFLFAALLPIASGLLVFFNFTGAPNITLPTPFYKKPFEFIIGFRHSVFAFLLLYFLTFMAVLVDNFNLGIFALLSVLLICMNFYTQPENEFYVWIFSAGSKGFLFQKIKEALLHVTILCFPVIAILGIFYFDNVVIVIGFLGLGYLYLITIILAKYSAYPDKMNLPQALLFALCIIFPPALLAVIPFFYLQSVKKLNQILE
jgi:hypothetical protein